MRALKALLTLGALAGLTACQQAEPKSDAAAALAILDSLDLALSAGPAQDTVSAVELGRVEEQAEAVSEAPAAPAKKRSSSAARRPSSSTAGQSGGSVARQPQTVTIRHTKRDAAIGAGAGAVIGAVASKNRVKGAVVGAVIGGAAGAVIGHTVDKETRVVY